MELNYVKDHLFDLLNESDLLDVSDIICDDKKGTFEIVVHDGDRFLRTCEEIKKYRLEENLKPFSFK